MVTSPHVLSRRAQSYSVTVPKRVKRLCQSFGGAQCDRMGPFRREQLAVSGVGEAVVYEEDDTPVRFGSDDSAGGLENFVHAGELIGKAKAIACDRLVEVFQKVIFIVEQGQANAHDNHAAETVSGKVYAF